jgi:hypothetical protein
VELVQNFREDLDRKIQAKKSLHPQKSNRKSIHGYESGGCGDRFIWFEGSLYKSFQGPLGCHPLCTRTTRLLLAPTAIKPVSKSFLCSLWALEKYCFVKMFSSAYLLHCLPIQWRNAVCSSLHSTLGSKSDIQYHGDTCV